jgi:membrane-bound serine protease (ClpP class)
MAATVEEAARRIGPVRRALLALGLVSVTVLGHGSGPAAAQLPKGPAVDIVKVDGVIDRALAGFVQAAVERAGASGATVVLQLDSRGTYGDEAMKLGRSVQSSGVPVVTWIGPSGARAAGGALSLVAASSLVAMAPGAGIGPARPFDLATRASDESLDDVVRGARELHRLASGSGPTPAGIDRLVAGAVLPAGPAIRAGVVRLAAPTIPELLQKIDGLSVTTTTGTRVLDTIQSKGGPADVRFRDLGFVDRILHAVSTPTAVYVLLLIGLWGIAFEFTQAGIGMAGIAGVLSLALAGYGLTVVPVHWGGIALILAATAAQGVDVIIRRVAVLTVAGTAAFAAGSFLAWWGVAPAVDLPLWLIVMAALAGFLLFGFGMTVALRARQRVRSTQVGLVGLVGETRSDLNPEGGVLVKGSLWRARSMNGPIPSGRRVRIKGIDGLILRVEEESD